MHHHLKFKVLAIWFQDLFSLSGLRNPPFLRYRGGGILPPPRYFFSFFSISSSVRFAIVMISDDGGKIPLTFCGFYQFHSWEYWHWNVLGLCSRGRNRALWLEQDVKKIASGKRQSRIQSYYRVSRWTHVADPLAAKRWTRQRFSLMSATNCLSSLREKCCVLPLRQKRGKYKPGLINVRWLCGKKYLKLGRKICI